MSLHLSFAWGLDAGPFEGVVLDVFSPDEPARWTDDRGREVAFHPFLVIAEGRGAGPGGTVAWLPYWHVIRENGIERTKYGQWAPCMDLPHFEELVAKARSKGYLKG